MKTRRSQWGKQRPFFSNSCHASGSSSLVFRLPFLHLPCSIFDASEAIPDWCWVFYKYFSFETTATYINRCLLWNSSLEISLYFFFQNHLYCWGYFMYNLKSLISFLKNNFLVITSHQWIFLLLSPWEASRLRIYRQWGRMWPVSVTRVLSPWTGVACPVQRLISRGLTDFVSLCHCVIVYIF